MTEKIPRPVDRFFVGKNARDFASAVSAFSHSAIVKDESRTHEGLAAIREWMEKTTRRYDDTAEVKSVAVDGGTVLVTALVSGTFPGSPITLRFRFTLDGDQIERLEIGS